jgi:exonuclease SbcD
MKLLHTSDLQLDAPFLFLGESGQRHRQQLRHTFAAIVEMARNGDYQMLLITGDLFNSNRPLQSTLDTVLHLLGKLKIPVCILPGNHDPYHSRSIYRRVIFPSNVTIFNTDLRFKVFPNLDLAIYGNAVTSKDDGLRPLEGVYPQSKAHWHVAMAHGNIVTGLVERPDRPIDPGEIEKCGMDYVALGDWHSFADYSQGSVKAIYSGAPEPTAYHQDGAGFLSRVTLTEGGVQVEKVRVGKIRAGQVYIDISGRKESEIRDLIMEHDGECRMVEVILSGLTEIGTLINPAELETILRPHFYALRICDQSHPKMDDISLSEYPTGHVIRKFIQAMSDQAQQAQDGHQKEIAEQALQLGVALLQGKDAM